MVLHGSGKAADCAGHGEGSGTGIGLGLIMHHGFLWYTSGQARGLKLLIYCPQSLQQVCVCLQQHPQTQ